MTNSPTPTEAVVAALVDWHFKKKFCRTFDEPFPLADENEDEKKDENKDVDGEKFLKDILAIVGKMEARGDKFVSLEELLETL